MQNGQKFPSGAFGAHGLLKAAPLATNCWPEAPKGGAGCYDPRSPPAQGLSKCFGWYFPAGLGVQEQMVHIVCAQAVGRHVSIGEGGAAVPLLGSCECLALDAKWAPPARGDPLERGSMPWHWHGRHSTRSAADTRMATGIGTLAAGARAPAPRTGSRRRGRSDAAAELCQVFIERRVLGHDISAPPKETRTNLRSRGTCLQFPFPWPTPRGKY